jgi:hypothetical protein
MTNHLHFLMQVGSEPLGGMMRQIASEYARAYQSRLETTGHLFERRYFARLVESERYLWALVRYIHMNPVTGGIVKSVDDYRWSSHRAYAGMRIDEWITTAPLLEMLAGSRAAAVSAYRAFMDCEPADVFYPLDQAKPASEPRVSAHGHAQTMATGHIVSLAQVIDEACSRFEVTLEQLRSTSRDVYLMQVRGWIARRAISGRIANLSDLSRALGRDRRSLRHAMRRSED